MLFVVDMYKMEKTELVLFECLVRCIAKYGKDYLKFGRSFKEHENYNVNDLYKSVNRRGYKFNDEIKEIIKSKVDKKYIYYVDLSN